MEEDAVEIRLMNEYDDALAVSDVYEKSWKYAYRGIVPDTYLDGIPRGQWADRTRSTDRQTLLLIKSGRIVGVSTFAKARMASMRGYGEVISLYLVPDEAHKGYGKRLLEEAVSRLEHMGFERVYLWVLEENTAARGFYVRCGFEESGESLESEIGGKRLREIQMIRQISKA